MGFVAGPVNTAFGALFPVVDGHHAARQHRRGHFCTDLPAFGGVHVRHSIGVWRSYWLVVGALCKAPVEPARAGFCATLRILENSGVRRVRFVQALWLGKD